VEWLAALKHRQHHAGEPVGQGHQGDLTAVFVLPAEPVEDRLDGRRILAAAPGRLGQKFAHRPGAFARDVAQPALFAAGVLPGHQAEVGPALALKRWGSST